MHPYSRPGFDSHTCADVGKNTTTKVTVIHALRRRRTAASKYRNYTRARLVATEVNQVITARVNTPCPRPLWRGWKNTSQQPRKRRLTKLLSGACVMNEKFQCGCGAATSQTPHEDKKKLHPVVSCIQIACGIDS